MFGLLEQDIDYIHKACEQFPVIEKAVIFGSRAMGNYKSASDVDLAIYGSKITREIIFRLYDLLNDYI